MAVHERFDYHTLEGSRLGNATLSERTGYNEKTVKRALVELVDAELVERTSRGGWKAGGGYTASTYRGVMPKPAKAKAKRSPDPRVAERRAKLRPNELVEPEDRLIPCLSCGRSARRSVTHPDVCDTCAAKRPN